MPPTTDGVMTEYYGQAAVPDLLDWAITVTGVPYSTANDTLAQDTIRALADSVSGELYVFHRVWADDNGDHDEPLTI